MTTHNYFTLTYPSGQPTETSVIIDGGGPSTNYDVNTVETPFPIAGGGRGAWPLKGGGGTLNAAGTAPGRFYRSKASTASEEVLAPGLLGYRAVRDGTVCPINDYAVYRGVMFLQRRFGETVDGILGPKTDAKIKAWQATQGLKTDGVYGPKTAKMMLAPLVSNEAAKVNATRAAELTQIALGTIGWESGWDHSAVGVQDPRDLGIAQIHIPVHTSLSVDDAFDPDVAIPWMVRFIYSNLQRMKFNTRDAVAAYNLGVGGARKWVDAGRPTLWTPAGSSAPRDMNRYIDAILNAA